MKEVIWALFAPLEFAALCGELIFCYVAGFVDWSEKWTS